MATSASGATPEVSVSMQQQVEAMLHAPQNAYDLTWSGCALGVFLAIPLALWLAWDLDGWGFFGKLLGMWVLISLAVAVVCGLWSDRQIRKAAATFNEWYPVQSGERAAAVAALNNLVLPPSPQQTKNAFAEEVMKKLGETPGAAAAPPEVALQQQLAEPAAPPAVAPVATAQRAAPPAAYPYIPLEPDRPKSEPRKTQKGERAT